LRRVGEMLAASLWFRTDNNKLPSEEEKLCANTVMNSAHGLVGQPKASEA
jgi:hypothetical protein